MYVATGEEYIKEVKLSARNTKQHTDLPIAVVSDREFESEYIDDIIVDESPDKSFFDKPRNLLKSPYDKTIYMDGDTFLLQAVPELFELLNHVDLATAIDPNEYELRYLNEAKMEEIPESVPLFQTGVIAYNNNKQVENFITNWKIIHQEKSIKRDQTSFRAAIHKSKINHMPLSNLYNCLARLPMQVTGKVKIIHGHLNVKSPEDIEQIESRMNASDDPRLFYDPRHEGRIYAPMYPYLNKLTLSLSKLIEYVCRMLQYSKRFHSSYQDRGFGETVRRSLRRIFL